jgi:hypothetical protein
MLKYLTGFDLSGIIKEKIRSMMSVMPDWLVDKLGFSVDTPQPDQSTPAKPAAKPDMSSAANTAMDRRQTSQSSIIAPPAPEGKLVIELTGSGAQGAQIKQQRSHGIGLETNLRRGPSFAGAG